MLTSEQKQLVVHVIAKTARAAKPYNNASGFVVAPGRILTVAHVLDGADHSTLEIRLSNLAPGNWVPAKLLWNGRDNGGTDLAVLSFDPELLTPTSRKACKDHSYHLINLGAWHQEVRWFGYGLPVSGHVTNASTGRPEAMPLPFEGNTGSPEPNSGGVLILSAEAGPNQPAGWGGASGSGVFIHGGLCAVVTEAYQGHTGKLRAQLLAPVVLAASGFPTAIGWEMGRDLLAVFAKETTNLLSGAEAPGLLDLLAKRLRLHGPNAKPVVNAMQALSTPHFVALGNVVGEDLVGDGTESRHPDSKKLAP